VSISPPAAILRSDFTDPRSASEPLPAASSNKPRKRVRGQKSSLSWKAKRDCQDRDVDDYTEKRNRRLQERSLRTPDAYVNIGYDILTDGNYSKPGWHGVPPPKIARDLILRRYASGDIKEDLRMFFPLEYPMPPQLSYGIPIVPLVTC
jgi:hypothetical protein